MTDVTPLTQPRGGTPAIIDSDDALASVLPNLACDRGPVAADTERAASFRYSGRAYLIQLKSPTPGVLLIDPLALSTTSLAALSDTLARREWVLHAASQDLPSLREVGLDPTRLFDTELAGRLLGYERVSLGTLVETILGLGLAKDHGNSDWSRRPLPLDWLTYAALDVEVLLQLRDRLADELTKAGKAEWATQEFAHALVYRATPRPDPWRRLKDLKSVTSRRGLALARALWEARNTAAAALDLSPHRLVRDQAIAAVAARWNVQPLADVQAALTSGPFASPVAARQRRAWLAAADEAAGLKRDELPATRGVRVGPPPVGRWARHDEAAAARWNAVRPQLIALAEANTLPVENLISPAPLQAVLWAPDGTDTATLDAQFAALDVRPWQRDLVVPVVAQALAELAD